MNPSRRDLLRTAGLAASAAAAGGSLSACSSPETIEAGPATVAAADVPVGSALVVENSDFVVSQPTAGEFKAFNRTCPHAGCPVSKVEKAEIVCTCHDARFSADDGSVLRGPAESGLKEAKATVSDGTVTVTNA